jgi:hypothetical protein
MRSVPEAVATGWLCNKPEIARSSQSLTRLCQNSGCAIKEDLNAEDAEVFAKARREVLYFANLCALCV